MAINRNSPEFLFGQIMQRLDEGDKVMEGFKDEMSALTRAINQLPCGDNNHRLKTLERWREKINGVASSKMQALTKFKHMIVVAVITASLLLLFAAISPPISTLPASSYASRISARRRGG